jgi:integrase
MAAREGIEVRHKQACRSVRGRRCNCDPTYRAFVWSPRDRRLVRRSFRTREEAEAWHDDARTALRKGVLAAPSRITLNEAAEAWLDRAKAGAIRNRRGDRYKPSALRGYARGLQLHVLPALGTRRLGELTRRDVQDFVDELLAHGYDPSTVKNILNPLQAIYRRALARGHVAVNPTVGLELPRSESTRDRIASPAEAAQLLSVLPDEDRAIWATAMYAGLRRGELRGLRWSDVDLDKGILRVERGWDDHEGEITGKTRAALRTVPIAAVLRGELVAHKLRTGRGGEALVFGATDERPFEPSTIRRRALAAWEVAGLTPIGLHECRHTFASLMIAAGVNAKALCSYMGHASVSITFDRYGHLMPGNESEAARLLDCYLERAVHRRR